MKFNSQQNSKFFFKYSKFFSDIFFTSVCDVSLKKDFSQQQNKDLMIIDLRIILKSPLNHLSWETNKFFFFQSSPKDIISSREKFFLHPKNSCLSQIFQRLFSGAWIFFSPSLKTLFDHQHFSLRIPKLHFFIDLRKNILTFSSWKIFWANFYIKLQSFFFWKIFLMKFFYQILSFSKFFQKRKIKIWKFFVNNTFKLKWIQDSKHKLTELRKHFFFIFLNTNWEIDMKIYYYYYSQTDWLLSKIEITSNLDIYFIKSI